MKGSKAKNNKWKYDIITGFFILLGLLIILVWPSPIRFVEQFNDQFSLSFRQIAFCKSFVCNDRIKIIAIKQEKFGKSSRNETSRQLNFPQFSIW